MTNGAPKKKMSGLAIALVIIGGGALLVLIGIGIAIYSVMSSPKGRAIVGMMGEGVKISAKAQKAPGTKELRAMGCKQAMVMEIADFERLMSYVDASMPARAAADDFGEMVICNVTSTPLPCDRVAATYVGAVGRRPKAFTVSVQQSGKHGPLCSNLYDADSNLIKPTANAAVPTPETSDTPEE